MTVIKCLILIWIKEEISIFSPSLLQQGGTSTRYCGKSPPAYIESLGELLEIEFHTNQVLFKAVIIFTPCQIFTLPTNWSNTITSTQILQQEFLIIPKERESGGWGRVLNCGCSVLSIWIFPYFALKMLNLSFLKPGGLLPWICLGLHNCDKGGFVRFKWWS